MNAHDTLTEPNVTGTQVESAERLARSVEKPLLRRYHAPRWDEPLIFQLSAEGHRGIEVPRVPEGSLNGSPEAAFRRRTSPQLPQVGQSQLLRHYLRLSQETLGADLNVDIGQGTCTMKYSPKINERFAGSPQSVYTHPMQDESTMQGTLQILDELQSYIAEVSGMDAVSLQAGSGSAAIYGNVKIVQAYHADRGEADQRVAAHHAPRPQCQRDRERRCAGMGPRPDRGSAELRQGPGATARDVARWFGRTADRFPLLHPIGPLHPETL